MPEIQGIEKLLSVTPAKRFGRFRIYGTGQFGFSVYGEEDIYFQPPGRDPILLSGIYRRDNVTGKVKYYRSPYYIVGNPRTELQQANRQKYADGVLAWQNLTDEQKIPYNIKSKGKHMSGYNVFLKEYLLSH